MRQVHASARRRAQLWTPRAMAMAAPSVLPAVAAVSGGRAAAASSPVSSVHWRTMHRLPSRGLCTARPLLSGSGGVATLTVATAADDAAASTSGTGSGTAVGTAGGGVRVRPRNTKEHGQELQTLVRRGRYADAAALYESFIGAAALPSAAPVTASPTAATAKEGAGSISAPSRPRLLPFVHDGQPRLSHERDFFPFVMYLESLCHLKGGSGRRARRAFEAWTDAHGFSPRHRALYDAMLLLYANNESDILKATLSEQGLEDSLRLLRQLEQHAGPSSTASSSAAVSPASYKLSMHRLAPIALALLRRNDVSTASWLYLRFRPVKCTRRLLEELEQRYAHADALGVCVDLRQDWEDNELGVVQHTWAVPRLRTKLTELRAHLDGSRPDKERWSDELLTSDPRLRDVRWVDRTLAALPQGETKNATSKEQQQRHPHSPAAAASSPSLTHPSDAGAAGAAAVARLTQLVQMGQATLGAFERAIRVASPQTAVEIWRVLQQAQPEQQQQQLQKTGSNPNFPGFLGSSLSVASLPSMNPAAASSSSSLAPTADLYNLAIQTICSSSSSSFDASAASTSSGAAPLLSLSRKSSTTREQSAFALALLHQMKEFDMHTTMLTYNKMLQALSGSSANPLASGLITVMRMYEREAASVRAAGDASSHPERGVFHVQLSAYEFALFAETRSPPPTPKLEQLVASRVAALQRAMDKQGLTQSESTLNSLLLFASYRRSDGATKLKTLRDLWGQMRLRGLPLLAPLALRLLALCAAKSGPGVETAPEAAVASDRDLKAALELAPFATEVWQTILVQHQQHEPSSSSSKANRHQVTAPFVLTPKMVEMRILGLARVFAALSDGSSASGNSGSIRSGDGASADAGEPALPPPSSTAESTRAAASTASAAVNPVQLQLDILNAFLLADDGGAAAPSATQAGEGNGDLGFVLSKASYLHVLAALTALRDVRRTKNLPASARAMQDAVAALQPESAEQLRNLDFVQLHAQLIRAMERASFTPPPQMLLAQWTSLLLALRNEVGSEDRLVPELLRVLNTLLRLSSSRPSFVTLAFLDRLSPFLSTVAPTARATTATAVANAAAIDHNALEFAKAFGSATQQLEDMEQMSPPSHASVRVLARTVAHQLARADLQSTACTAAEVAAQAPMERAAVLRESSVWNQQRVLSPLTASLLDDGSDKDVMAAQLVQGVQKPVLLTGRHLLRGDSAVEDNDAAAADAEDDALLGTSSFADSFPVATAALSNDRPPSTAASLLVLSSLRGMLAATLDLEADTRGGDDGIGELQRTPERTEALTVLLEALWESARLFNVQDQLFSGPLCWRLTRALLFLRHPDARDMLLRFWSQVHPRHLWPRSRVREPACALLLDILEFLLSERRPLSEVDEWLLELDRLATASFVTNAASAHRSSAAAHAPVDEEITDAVSALVTSSPRFYRAVFVAYGVHHQTVKLMYYFTRALAQPLALPSQTIEFGQQPTAQDLSTLLPPALQGSALELIESLDRCGEATALDEALAVILRAGGGPSTRVGADGVVSSSAWARPMLSAALRACVRLSAFMDARMDNGWRPSRRGVGVLSRVTQLLSSPLARAAVPERDVLLHALKYALLCEDQACVEAVLTFMRQHASVLQTQQQQQQEPSFDASALQLSSPSPWPALPSSAWRPLEEADVQRVRVLSQAAAGEERSFNASTSTVAYPSFHFRLPDGASDAASFSALSSTSSDDVSAAVALASEGDAEAVVALLHDLRARVHTHEVQLMSGAHGMARSLFAEFIHSSSSDGSSSSSSSSHSKVAWRLRAELDQAATAAATTLAQRAWNGQQ